jgi:hypothetical protein
MQSLFAHCEIVITRIARDTDELHTSMVYTVDS